MRHRVPVAAASAVLVACVVGGGATLIEKRKSAAEAERAQVATAFVAELFGVDASLDGAGSRPTQALLLERGAKLIEARFEKQPAIRADLYGALGRVYVELGQAQLGSEFGNRQLQILREQRASDRQVAQSLLLLSEAARTAHRDADAESYAQQAVALLRSDESLKAYALGLLANTQADNGKLTQAAETISQGKAIVAAGKLQPSVAMAWLLWAEAYLLVIQNRFDEALPLKLRATEQALAAEGPDSSAAFEMRVVTARRLIQRSRFQEGRKIKDEAIGSFESLGGVHRIRAELAKAHLAEIEFGFEASSYAEAVGVVEQVKSFLAHQPSVPAELLAQVDLELVYIYYDYSDYAKAEALMAPDIPVLKAASQSLREQLEIATGLGRYQMGA